MKNDRLFQMIYLLLERGSMTAPEISKLMEVSVRTVYRDIETLSRAGVPVYATQGKGGGISLMSGYTLDKTIFSQQEQQQLLFAVQSLQATNQPMGDLLNKLDAIFRTPKTDWIVVDFSRWGMQQQDNQRFEQLKTAILGKQVLRLVYCGSSGEKTERMVHPLRLIFKDKNWYMQGYCLRAKDFRLFKMGRILEATTTGETFFEDYSHDIPPIETSSPVCKTANIQLRFSRFVAFRVYDEFDYRYIKQEEDGSLFLEVEFPMDTWVVSYLFSFGVDVEVLEPISLKEELRKYAEKIMFHHGT